MTVSYSSPAPLRVVVIGAGVSGISQAVRLQDDLGDRVQIKVYERGSEPGGIWATSKWPGAGVDTPSHIYALYSDPNPHFTRHYSSQPEVLAYWTSLIDKYGLRDNFRYNSEFVGSAWSHADQSHTLTFRRSTGETFQVVADVLISANGPLSTPLIPKIPGLKEKYRGKYFHNLRWDAEYDFRNKRVAVVGNGSSGVQLVPGVAEIEGVQLTHFIRSGGYFVPQKNYDYSPLVKFAFRWIPGFHWLHRIDLFFQSIKRHTRPPKDPTRSVEAKGLLDYLAATAPAEYLSILTPNYPLGCKRVALDAGWLASLHRPNVDLVGKKITAADKTGLITEDGVHREFDVIIFATGSAVAEHGVGLNIGIKGEGGLELREFWKSQGGPKAYLGTSIPKFPNYFAVLGPNAVAGSWGWSIGVKGWYNSRLIRGLLDNNLSSIQPTEAAFEAYNKDIHDRLRTSLFKSDACTSWWGVGQGQDRLVSVPSPDSSLEYLKVLRHIRWDDWLAVKRVAGADAATTKGTGGLRRVDVKSRVLKRRTRKVVGWTAVSLLLLVLARLSPRGGRIIESIVQSAREGLTRVFR